MQSIFLRYFLHLQDSERRTFPLQRLLLCELAFGKVAENIKHALLVALATETKMKRKIRMRTTQASRLTSRSAPNVYRPQKDAPIAKNQFVPIGAATCHTNVASVISTEPLPSLLKSIQLLLASVVLVVLTKREGFEFGAMLRYKFENCQQAQ